MEASEDLKNQSMVVLGDGDNNTKTFLVTRQKSIQVDLM